MLHHKRTRWSILLVAVAMLATIAQPASATSPELRLDTPERTREAVASVLSGTPLAIVLDQTAGGVAGSGDRRDAIRRTADRVEVRVPREPGQNISAVFDNGPTLAIGIPGAERASNATVTTEGLIVYEDAQPETDVVVQLTDVGVRQMVVIEGSSAPERFEFSVDVAGRESIKMNDDGSASVYGGDGVGLATAAAPWAIDANGNEVPAWYSVRGDSLVLNVDHSEVTAYPVVADPWWNPFSWCWSCILKSIVCFQGGLLVVNLSSNVGFIIGAASGVPAIAVGAAYVGMAGGAYVYKKYTPC